MLYKGEGVHSNLCKRGGYSEDKSYSPHSHIFATIIILPTKLLNFNLIQTGFNSSSF